MRRRTRDRTRRPARNTGRGHGFTLLELLIVMIVIAIIIAFILTAARDGIRQAETRATQALITKLEAGMSDRIDALVATRADANAAHASLAAVFGPASAFSSGRVESNSRAQILARFDQFKAEFPDVFIVQNDTNYPLNFGAAPFPSACGVPASTYGKLGSTSPSGASYCQYLLPFGSGILNDPGGFYGSGTSMGAVPGAPLNAASAKLYSPALVIPESTGIFGASYTAASGIYKNLVAAAVAAGATPPKPANVGYDGADNDNNGLIDDIGENGTGPGSVSNFILTKLLPLHTHKTARAEMLYALLVEGQGPFGSVFNRDDFTDSEVKDTDGDGLPEFVDAWGEPLQFFRWPVFYISDAQKGPRPYGTVFETRQQNPLDPNQRLMEPFWWSGVSSSTFAANIGAPYCPVQPPLSASAFAFQTLFTMLVDPNQPLSSTGANLWDRGSAWPARRAYYSRFLILSGGPDKTPGVPIFDPAYYQALTYNFNVTAPSTAPAFSGATPVAVPTDINPANASSNFITSILNLRIEDQAAPATFVRTNPTFYTFTDGTTPYAITTAPSTDLLNAAISDAGSDDVVSQKLQAPGGATQ